MNSRQRKMSSFQLMEEADRAQEPANKKSYWLFAIITVVSIVAAYAAFATPWDVQNPDGSWSPNPDCTGSCQETGIPNPPEPEPKQSHEGKGKSVYDCGCGYGVILSDGITEKAAEQACQRQITEKQRQSCHWPNGIYPGDKG